MMQSMATREFTDRDGRWRVWKVQPSSSATGVRGNAPSEGWLCFESVETQKRVRLPLREAKPDWYEGADIFLRQLLARTKKAPKDAVTTKTAAAQRRQVEDDARDAG